MAAAGICCALSWTPPLTRRVLFDLPEVTGQLDFNHERLTVQAGDLFADPMPVADAYLLMEVLHGWPDGEAVKILRGGPAGGTSWGKRADHRNVLPDQDPDPRGPTLDVIMLAVTGGKERTPSQFAELFNQAGLSDPTITKTDGPLRIAEPESRVITPHNSSVTTSFAPARAVAHRSWPRCAIG